MSFAAFYKQTLVACSLLLCSFSANADAPSLTLTLTHTDTSELKPISSFNIARAQFLPDIDDNPYSYFDRIEEDHNRGGCQKSGFQYTKDNCPAPRILKNKCPFGTGYAECYCAGSPTCTGRTSSYSNPYPSSTGASQSTCKDCGGKTLYNWSCDSSACSGYMIYGSCPSHGNCSRCCDGYYKLNSCDSGYEISGSGGQAKCILSETCFGDTSRNSELGYSCSSCTNKSGQTLYTCSCTGACSLSSCPSNGYCSTDCKGKYCLNSCKSGYSVSGNSCVKDCVPNSCSGYPLYSQPANGTYETCSVGCGSGTYKYRLTGCNNGYYLDGTGCTKCDKVNTRCDSGKTLVNTCQMANGATVGDCVDCRDESSPYNPCYGYYICEGDKVGSGSTCNCGSQTYYENCLVKETCTYGINLEVKNGAWQSAYLENNSYFTTYGYYKVTEKCTRVDRTKVFWAKECNANSKDYLGNDAPCKGYKTCEAGQTPVCSCGGKNYCEESACPYGINLEVKNGAWQSAYLENSSNFTAYGYYKVTEKCTRDDGTKVFWAKECNASSKDYLDNDAPCKGYKTCETGQTPVCSCGGKNYCEENACTYGINLEIKNGAWQAAYLENNSYFTTYGYYKVTEKCTRDDGTKVFWAKECNANSKDYLGNDAPCKGYKTCPSGEIAGGEICTCGGKTYGTLCLASCNYEDTPATCSAKGMIFTLKCSDESGNQFGECS